METVKTSSTSPSSTAIRKARPRAGNSKLKAMIRALPRGRMQILNNSRGRLWTKDGFKTSLGKERAKLKIEGMTSHGTFITERRRERIASITGGTHRRGKSA